MNIGEISISIGKYIGIRITQIIPVIFTVIIITFLLVHLAPGDIAFYFSGQEKPTAEEMELTRKMYGLDKPLWTQFLIYVGKVIRLDLGESWIWGVPVIQVILWKIPATFLMIFTSFIFSLIFGILLGTYVARKHGGKFDFATSLTLLALYSTPIYWGGLMLITIFAINLNWFPTSGIVYITKEAGIQYYLEIIHHLFLPAFSMMIFYMLGLFFRITRSSVIELMDEDFVKTAKAIGYNEGIVMRKHVLRNALLPVVTLAGYQMGIMFSGAMITETVFAWPGMGRLTYQAILGRDIPLIMGTCIIGCLCVIFANLAIDILYTFLDPRIKLE